jgi:hypothetical protein
MTTKAEVLPGYWWRNGWPGGLGSLLMMSLGLALKRWLPLHFAMGIGGFAAWFLVGLIYARRHDPKYGMPVWLAALVTGVSTGLFVGLLSYYLPW